MRFKQYLLNEKTFRIGADVDLIYNLAFKDILKIVKQNKPEKFIQAIKKTHHIGNGEYIFAELDSSKLKSKHAMMAHDINPIKIVAGLLNMSSYYDPKKKQVLVSLNANAISLINAYQIKSFEDMEKNLAGNDEFKRWMGELSEKNIKGSIYHELSHWIDDSLHNFHITKGLKKAAEAGNRDLMKRSGFTFFTDYEINAQVHAIKQLKRHFNKSWDLISWNDILQLKPSFNVVRNALRMSEPKVQKDYFKRMTKRLNREKLLGKTMQKTFMRDMV